MANPIGGLGQASQSHEEVLAVGRESATKVGAVLAGVVETMGT